MQKLIAFLFFLYPFSLIGQIKIIDEESKLPVSYATVSFGNGSGLFADDEGIFIFTKQRYPDVDSLFISALGYKSIQLSSQKLPAIINLKLEADLLDEIIVSAPINRKFKILKNKPILDNTYENCWLPTIESEIAVFLPKEDGRDQQLIKVQFPIALESVDWNKRNNKNATKKEFSTLFKVQFYDSDNGIPGTPMHTETIVKLVTQNNGDFFEIDIEHLNLIMPDNGCFVSIQVLGYADKNGKILPNKKYKEIKGRNGMVKIPTNFRPLLPFTSEHPNYRTFTKRAFISGNTWKVFAPNKGIESRLIDKGLSNYGVGITVKAFKD